MKYHLKYLLGGLICGIIIGIPSGYFLTQLHVFSLSEYTKVTVVAGQPEVIEFDDNIYGFGYTQASQYNTALLSMMTGGLATKVYNATEGAVYRDYGIEIKVIEAQNDYLILNVKSTVP